MSRSHSTDSHLHHEHDDRDYIRRTDARNKDYTKDFEQWVASLSPAERQKAEALGVIKPIENFHRVSGHSPDQDRDAADSSQSQVSFDPGEIDTPATPSATGISPEAMQVITRIVGTIIAHENVKIATAALAFALNMDGLNGLGSIREYAARIGVSPEAISKAKRKWEQELALPPNAFAKTAKAKAALSLAQQTKHWKKAKWKAASSTRHHT